MNILAICHSCRRKHTYSARGDELYHRIGEWRTKHPPGRCDVEYVADLGAHGIVNRVHHEYGHNADVKLAYATSTAFTITLASLTTSSTFTVGRESTAVSNTTNLYEDHIVGGGKVTTGTSPTAGAIRVYAYGATEDTPTYPDVLQGTDNNRTFTSEDIRDASVSLIGLSETDTTSDRTYWFRPVSLTSAFNGVHPTHFGLFVVHNTAVNLNATGSNHAFEHTGVYRTVA